MKKVIKTEFFAPCFDAMEENLYIGFSEAAGGEHYFIMTRDEESEAETVVKLQISSQSRYYYPDVTVSCDPQDLNSRKFIQNPKLIAEVLSPSTSGKDRDEKFTAYLKIPSLQEYLLIDSKTISVERYCRGEGRMWLYYPYTAGDIVTLSSIEFELPIELLYENVSFATDTET